MTTDPTLNADDPWTCDYPARIQLAKSVLEHARDAGSVVMATAIDRALLALQGAFIDEIQRMTA